MIRRHITPALVGFIALLLGCLSSPLLGSHWWWTAALSLVAAAVGTSVIVPRAPSRPGKAWRRAGLLLLSVSAGLLLGAASQARMSLASARSFLPMPETEVTTISGTVVQDSSLSQKGDTVVRLAMSDASSGRRGITARARGGLLLFVDGDYRFSIGERVRVQALPAPLEGPGPERWVARARRAEVTTLGFTGPVWAFRADARNWLHRSVSRVGYPASALLEALLIGAREDVPGDLYDGFMRTGSLHILALSGLHVTVIYGIAAGLLWFLRNRWQRYLAATLVLLFFQFLAGFMPSLLRATVMIVIGGIALLLDRDHEPLNVLSLSGIVILMIDPFQAFTLSFQLSFLALAGILGIGAVIQRPLASRLPRFLLVAFAMSTGAQIATLPLVIARFGTYYPSGLVASLVLVPLTTGYLWAGLAWLPLSTIPWPLLHDACARVFSVFYEVIRWCAQALAVIPGFTFAPSVVPWLAAAAGLAAVLAATVLPVKRPVTRLVKPLAKRPAA
jgi:competence protein ComEC